ncbi:succinyl-:3-ketoacid-coenzyme A transferase mitochondrial precursor [Fusarium coicis]|nr:succinyl-:3-ketoacid-coenzyme A transferase mitochondrial precursor [Fusarium coicis]
MMRSAFRAQASTRLWTLTQRSFSASTVLRRINKICASENDAIQKVKSGSTVLVGGFGFSGVPESLIEAVAARKDLKDLTVVSNNAGMPGVGLVQTGELPVRYNRDGSVALMSRPRETREFHGKKYILEEAIFADVALIKVHKADRLGNCTFRKAQNNFNEAMAKNAKLTIVEADEIVDVGQLDPESVHIQGIYVDVIIQSTRPKKIEKLTFAQDAKITNANQRRESIIKRASKELKDGMYVNLGIGMPLATPGMLPDDLEVILQSENGILGMGRYPNPGEEDPDLINPGKETVTLNPGASTFGSHESFGMIRAGKIDLTMLDLANFMLPGKVKGIGGAMDLVASPEKTKVIITMEHVDRNGNPKILEECTFPLTGPRCVSRIITDLAVFDCTPEGLVLRELVDEVEIDELKSKTGAPFRIADDLIPYQT